MNVVSRGVKNALRSPLRSGAIVIMLGISIGLIVAMLVARSSVETKISDLKGSTATGITINPAGISGGFGGGDNLTSDQLKKVVGTAHVKSANSSLRDQMASTDTNLTPSLTLGTFGQRQQRFEGGGGGNFSGGGGESAAPRTPPTPRTTVTGTTDPNSTVTNGGTLTISSGATINGNSSDLVALVGQTLATKNNLTVGSTFTAYTQTVTVKGIYSSGNTFQDSGIIMPLATVQNLTTQAGAISSINVTVDSADNVASVVSSLKTTLADKADITSQQEQAQSSVSSLQSISNLAMTGVIGATVAGAAIILLTMTMIVRERRREIGVVKAIGGNNFKVITQFVTEALTLTIIGGIIGLAGGVLISGNITQSLVQGQETSQATAARGAGGAGGGIRNFASRAGGQIGANVRTVTSTVTPQVFASAIGITLLIAIVGSALPAWLIAKVRPAEVLRTE